MQATDVYAFPKDGSGPPRYVGTWYDLGGRLEYPAVAAKVLKPFDQWNWEQKSIVREWVQIDSMSLRYSDLPLKWIEYRNTIAPNGAGYDIWALSDDLKTLIVEDPGHPSLVDMGWDLAQMRDSAASAGGIPDSVRTIRIEQYSDTVYKWLDESRVDLAYQDLFKGWERYYRSQGGNTELVYDSGTKQIRINIPGRDPIVIELETVFQWPSGWPL
jgi:hypothetical protein